jgi:hypothetical protein
MGRGKGKMRSDRRFNFSAIVKVLALASRCIVLMYKVAICHSST